MGLARTVRGLKSYTTLGPTLPGRINVRWSVRGMSALAAALM
jgi:hypothetical protein